MTSELNESVVLATTTAKDILRETVKGCFTSSKFVLVVDDDFSTTSLVSSYLKSKSVHDFIVSSLEAAIDLLQISEVRCMVGAAIVDLVFEHGDVNELIKELLDHDIMVFIYSSKESPEGIIRPELLEKISFFQKGSLQTLKTIYSLLVPKLGLSPDGYPTQMDNWG